MAIQYAYMGKPVVRIRRVRDGVLLTFPNKKLGNKHPRMVVSQEDWKLHGSKKIVDRPA